ncbi:unnamed protein product [Calypogeia fissa]
MKMESRPITHQGILSMRIPFQGPGRKILDKSYFIGKLRAKKQELQNEITTMMMEIEQLEKRAPANFQLDQRQDLLLQEVKLLKGQLGDYNMVMESVATGVELQQLKDIMKCLKEQNDHERKSIAQVFTKRSQMEKATKDAEQAYSSTMFELETRLGREGPEKLAKFNDAMEENKLLNGEVEKLERILEELNNSIEPLEQDLEKAPPSSRTKLMLVEQLLSAQEQFQQMQEKDAKSFVPVLPPKEASDALVSKIKYDTAQLASAVAKSRELEIEIRLYEEKLVATEKALNDLKGGRAEKFIEMQQKEKKMQNFLDNYEATFHEHTTTKQALEQTIVHMREQISQVTCSSSSSNDTDKKADDNGEQLNQELEIQRGELKALEKMEAQTVKEVDMCNQKIATLRNEINRLINLDDARSASDSKCLDLEAHKKALEEERSRIQVKLKEQNEFIDSIQQQLRDSPLHKNIETLNNKFIDLQQNVTRGQEELEMKERETNYKPMLENIRLMVAQLNEEIRSKLNS